MIRRFGKFLARLTSGLRNEDGTASIEFVLTLPWMLVIFMASFEGGLLMVRQIMLEQSVDMTMRELRLGHYTLPTAALLKTEICKRTVILGNCEDNITIEMQRVSTANFALPTSSVMCVNRSEAIEPVTAFSIGQQNDIMLVRVCVVQDLIFPTSGIGLHLPKDPTGGYGIVAVTAFVTEPS